jgi:hypothetical protein
MNILEQLKSIDNDLDRKEIHFDVTVEEQQSPDIVILRMRDIIRKNKEWRKKAIEMFEQLHHKK